MVKLLLQCTQSRAQDSLLGPCKALRWRDRQLLSESWVNMALTPTGLQSPYGFINYFLNTDRKQWPSAPGTAFMHNGNGLNMIYVDPEHDLVAVVRWIDNNAVDGFLKRLIGAVVAKS